MKDAAQTVQSAKPMGERTAEDQRNDNDVENKSLQPLPPSKVIVDELDKREEFAYDTTAQAWLLILAR